MVATDFDYGFKKIVRVNFIVNQGCTSNSKLRIKTFLKVLMNSLQLINASFGMP